MNLFAFILYPVLFVERVMFCFFKTLFHTLADFLIVFTSPIGIFLFLYRIIIFPFLFLIDFFTAFYISFKVCLYIAINDLTVKELGVL